MIKKTLVIGLCLVFVTGSIFASSILRGSDYVRLGKQSSLNGILTQADGEWYLTTDGKEEYSLHLGNYEVMYPNGISLTSGQEAFVKGFVYDQDISAITVVSEGKSWEFRSIEGRPLWSGSGNRQNEKTDSNVRNSEWHQ
jgi:hypothetical protein